MDSGVRSAEHESRIYVRMGKTGVLSGMDFLGVSKVLVSHVRDVDGPHLPEIFLDL